MKTDVRERFEKLEERMDRLTQGWVPTDVLVATAERLHKAGLLRPPPPPFKFSVGQEVVVLRATSKLNTEGRITRRAHDHECGIRYQVDGGDWYMEQELKPISMPSSPPYKFHVGQEVVIAGATSDVRCRIAERFRGLGCNCYTLDAGTHVEESSLRAVPSVTEVTIESIERKMVKVSLRPGMVVAPSDWGSWKGKTFDGKDYGRILGHEGHWVRIVEGHPDSVYMEKKMYDREHAAIVPPAPRFKVGEFTSNSPWGAFDD
jgi:hypothetical protein